VFGPDCRVGVDHGTVGDETTKEYADKGIQFAKQQRRRECELSGRYNTIQLDIVYVERGYVRSTAPRFRYLDNAFPKSHLIISTE
jgi:hypothetical protein